MILPVCCAVHCNKVRRAKHKSKKMKPPSYEKVKSDMYKGANNIPKIPPPPYESYEDYCKRISK